MSPRDEGSRPSAETHEWQDHLAPVRAIGRVAYGALVRVGLALVPFATTAVLALLLGRRLLGDDPRNPAQVELAFHTALAERLALAGLLAFACGSLRAIESLEVWVKPDKSYARKLVHGALVGYGSFLVVYALLLQLQYVRGLFEGAGVSSGLEKIGSGESVAGERGLGDLAGIALAFGLAAFGRARRLPLREQTFLVAALVLGWILLRTGEHFVFELAYTTSASAWRVADDLALWALAWIAALLVPALAAAGDRIERRWMPRALARRAVPGNRGSDLVN